MNSAFVERIEDPDRLQLQEQQESAREAVRERLRRYDMTDVPDYVLRKLTYTTNPLVRSLERIEIGIK